MQKGAKKAAENRRKFDFLRSLNAVFCEGKTFGTIFEMETMNEIRTAGVYVFGHHTETKISTVVDALNKRGILRLAPRMRREHVLLAAACRKVAAASGIKGRVEAHKKPSLNGHEFVAIQRDEDDNEYRKVFDAKVNGGAVQASRLESEIQAAFDNERNLYSAAQMAELYRKICETHCGTIIVPRLWFIPDEYGSEFKSTASAVLVGSILMYSTVRTDKDTVRTVINRVRQNVEGVLNGIADEVSNAEFTPGMIQRRMATLAEIQETIGTYERSLGESLAELSETAKRIQDQIAAVTLAAIAQ